MRTSLRIERRPLAGSAAHTAGEGASVVARSWVSISARDGGVAPVRVHVIAEAATAYETARLSSASSAFCVALRPNAPSSMSAATRAAPKLSPAPTVSTTGTGMPATSAKASPDAAIAPWPPLVTATTVGPRARIRLSTSDGTSKFRSFLVPTIERQIERGGPLRCAALALAGWARYLATVPPAARAPDSHGEHAVVLAGLSLVDASAFLELDEVFTPLLRASPQFRDEFTAAAGDLAQLGPIGAMEAALAH
jgi:hypothetical protein